jgi:MFS family permease
MPTFAESIGLSSSTGAGLVAAFNAASAVGRISSGFLSDKIGSVNVALMSMSLLGTTMFLIWPFASTLGVLIVFVVVAGVAVGGFFSMMPTVVGHIFGSANMSVTMGMILTSWTFGYLLVRRVLSPLQLETSFSFANRMYRVPLSQATSWKPAAEQTMALLPTGLQCTLPVLSPWLRRL